MVLLDRDQRARMESGGRRTKRGFALLAIGLLSVATARGEEAPKPAAAVPARRSRKPVAAEEPEEEDAEASKPAPAPAPEPAKDDSKE